MLLEPVKQLALDSNWHGFEPAPDGRHFVMGLRPDRFRVLNPDFTTRNEFKAPATGSWQISPDGRLLAIVNGPNLSVVSLDGQLLYHEQSAPSRASPLDDLKFTADQRFLWTVRHYPDYQIEVQVRETATWQVLRSALFPEPAPPASVSLHPHPEGKVMAIWAASGQDGQWVYWAYDDGRTIQIYEVPGLEFTTPPEFHPSGGEFILTHHYDYLERYRFPECELLGSFEWDDEDDDCQMGCNPSYLSDRRALINTNEDRLFLVDLESMCLLDELIFKGHEPRPCGEVYPISTNSRPQTLLTDLVGFRIVGRNRLLTEHRKLPDENDYSAILWDTSTLFGRFSPLRDDASFTTRLLQMRGWQ